jgi:hypothetical protein
MGRLIHPDGSTTAIKAGQSFEFTYTGVAKVDGGRTFQFRAGDQLEIMGDVDVRLSSRKPRKVTPLYP